MGRKSKQNRRAHKSPPIGHPRLPQRSSNSPAHAAPENYRNGTFQFRDFHPPTNLPTFCKEREKQMPGSLTGEPFSFPIKNNQASFSKATFDSAEHQPAHRAKMLWGGRGMTRWLLILLMCTAPLWAQTRQIDLSPGVGWVDTGIDLKVGDTVRVTATGELQYTSAKQSNGPDGLPRAFTDLVRVMQLNDAGRGALIGRVGSSDAARPFLLGASGSHQAPVDGHLFVAVNQAGSDLAMGSYRVKIERTAATARAKATADAKVPAFSQSLVDSIPKRASDADDNPGDRVNFILIGSQEQVQEALKAAGWVLVDRSKGDAVVSGLLASFSKQSYVTLPMSELQLFGRPQDFGYAQADPLRVVASRHHFRLWKAPFELEGRQVWAGAGTHDIGFDRDQRNNGITHKIDPETDGERDYIGESLTQTGMVAKTMYMTPTDPVTTAKTATGGEFHSDGRTLLVYLTAL